MRSGKNDAPVSVNLILEKFVQTLDYSKVEKNNSIAQCWLNIVPEIFKNKTKPLKKTPDGTLFVACENSLVSNELVMMKKEIITKIPEEIGVNNIVFSHKAWKNNDE